MWGSIQKMILKQIWIISNNGLQLFFYDIEKNGGVTNAQERMSNFLKASGIFNIVTYFNQFLLEEPVSSFLTNNLLWVLHYETIMNYETNKEINYAIIALAQIDLTVPIEPQQQVITQFCKTVSMEFYSECGDQIEAFTNLQLEIFEGFKPRCVSLIKTFEEEIADALERRLLARTNSNKK